MGGLTLTNTRLKPELATWEPHASEIIFKGAWESTDDVTIDFE